MIGNVNPDKKFKLGATTHGADFQNFEIFENGFPIYGYWVRKNHFSKNIFENRVMKNKLQKFFRDNFRAFKYF